MAAQQQTPGETEILLGTASQPVFPFFILKFEQGEAKEETYLLSMKVRPEIYNYVKTVFGKDEVIFYLDPLVGQIQAWTPSMHASFEMVEKLGLMSSIRIWIMNARAHLAKFLAQLRPPQ
ncbi:MAG: hypothetical protein M1503_07705 [Thaumarchaeota archaeon]|nr:hypothetical protein [Nitrososphaerota archaeon]MCL5318127.1 hypothetical protein [Nitrososphaerota archaeon]